MRRLHALSNIAAIAALALGALTLAARAQTSMTFRPLPPESVSQVRTATGKVPSIQVHGTDRSGRVVDVRIDSNSISINAPRPPAADVPAAPGTPESQSTHETAGDIVKAIKEQKNVTIAADSIELEKPLKTTGDHVLKIRAAGAESQITFVIVAA